MKCKFGFLWADSRFAEPRSFRRFFLRPAKRTEKAHGVCRPDRDKLSAKRKVSKGFNFVRGKVLFGCADSRLGKPRSSRQGSTDWYFLRRAKSTAKTRRGLRPSGLRGAIQISARYVISAEITGHHHVTGRAGYFNLSGYRR